MANDSRIPESTAEVPEPPHRLDLAQMVSHDIKTHLAVILGFVGLLRDATLDAADASDAIDRIESNAREAVNLTVGFLHAEEVDHHGLTIHRAESSLNQIAEDAVRNAAPRARLREIDLRLDADPRIPPLPIDVAMFTRAIANLIDNAIHHSRAGQSIHVETERRDDGASIAVRDRGSGIPAEQLPHLFERFARGANPAHTTSTGLGLYIVGKVVEAHGGKVTVDQPSDGGTKFTIFVPCRAV